MAEKTIVEKAGMAVGFGMAMAEDVAGTLKTAVEAAVTSVGEALKKGPVKKVAKKAAKKAPAKKVATKKAAKKAASKKATAKKAAKKAIKKTGAKKAGKKSVKTPAKKASRLRR
jgi:hypothetical protein